MCSPNLSLLGKITVFLIFIQCFPVVNSAQELLTKPVFKNLTPIDGLSQSAVRCLLQDQQGFIWIGTDGA